VAGRKGKKLKGGLIKMIKRLQVKILKTISLFAITAMFLITLGICLFPKFTINVIVSVPFLLGTGVYVIFHFGMLIFSGFIREYEDKKGAVAELIRFNTDHINNLAEALRMDNIALGHKFKGSLVSSLLTDPNAFMAVTEVDVDELKKKITAEIEIIKRTVSKLSLPPEPKYYKFFAKLFRYKESVA
jgi:hypothetical protein